MDKDLLEKAVELSDEHRMCFIVATLVDDEQQ